MEKPRRRRVMKKKLLYSNMVKNGRCASGKHTDCRTPVMHDEIAQHAFSFYESYGRGDGQHIEDWLQAEQELVRHFI
jgi:hypothetical protein